MRSVGSVGLFALVVLANCAPAPTNIVIPDGRYSAFAGPTRDGYAALEAGDRGPIHAAALEALLREPSVWIRSDLPRTAETDARAHRVAAALIAGVNIHLQRTGLAALGESGVPEAEAGPGSFTGLLLVSSPRARLVMARKFGPGNMEGIRSEIWTGLNLAAVPEAFSPSAELTVEEIMQRATVLRDQR